MKLVISDMSNDKRIHIKEVTASYTPHVGTQLVLTQGWSGESPTMHAFCAQAVDPAFLASINSCKTRPLDALYNFPSGFVTCHCDQFCSKFNDCCPDFSAVKSSSPFSADNLNHADTLTVSCKSNQFPQTKHPGIGIYVVTSCLADREDTDYGRECRGVRNVAFIPVGSRGIVYRNVFVLCAMISYRQTSCPGRPQFGMRIPTGHLAASEAWIL